MDTCQNIWYTAEGGVMNKFNVGDTVSFIDPSDVIIFGHDLFYVLSNRAFPLCGRYRVMCARVTIDSMGLLSADTSSTIEIGEERLQHADLAAWLPRGASPLNPMGFFTEPSSKAKEAKCDCGSDFVGSPRHSDYCPKYVKS